VLPAIALAGQPTALDRPVVPHHHSPMPKPKPSPKLTGPEALATALKHSYPMADQVLQAAALAPRGAMAEAAVQRLLDSKLKVVSRALTIVLLQLPWTGDQQNAVAQAWLAHPDKTSTKSLVFLELLVAAGSTVALEQLSQLNRAVARALLNRDSIAFLTFPPHAQQQRLQFLREQCREIAEREPEPAVLPPVPAGKFRYYDVTIAVLESEIPATRRFLIAHDRGWNALHYAIQRASASWDNSHLWALYAGNGRKLVMAGGEDGEGLAEWGSPIAELIEKGHRAFVYRYDFGDDWRVAVKVAAKAVLLDEDRQRTLLEGQGGFPPEDCGGYWGLAELVEAHRKRTAAAAANPTAKTAKSAKKRQRVYWGEGYAGWDPDWFDFAATKKAFDC
jgi:hypothetical protein